MENRLHFIKQTPISNSENLKPYFYTACQTAAGWFSGAYLLTYQAARTEAEGFLRLPGIKRAIIFQVNLPIT